MCQLSAELRFGKQGETFWRYRVVGLFIQWSEQVSLMSFLWNECWICFSGMLDIVIQRSFLIQEIVTNKNLEQRERKFKLTDLLFWRKFRKTTTLNRFNQWNWQYIGQFVQFWCKQFWAIKKFYFFESLSPTWYLIVGF